LFKTEKNQQGTEQSTVFILNAGDIEYDMFAIVVNVFPSTLDTNITNKKN